MLRRLLVPAALLVLVSGCGGTGASQASGGPAAGPPSASTVTFKETEYTISPDTLKLAPGTYTVEVQNLGQFPHDLHIAAAADGTEVGFSPVIKAGESASFQVTLKAASYVTWCAVDGHKPLGMQGTLTVA